MVNKLSGRRFPALWSRHGKAAGHIRNIQMLREGYPDLVICFPGRTGTANMEKISRQAGTPVLIITENGNVIDTDGVLDDTSPG